MIKETMKEWFLSNEYGKKHLRLVLYNGTNPIYEKHLIVNQKHTVRRCRRIAAQITELLHGSFYIQLSPYNEDHITIFPNGNVCDKEGNKLLWMKSKFDQ